MKNINKYLNIISIIEVIITSTILIVLLQSTNNASYSIIDLYHEIVYFTLILFGLVSLSSIVMGIINLVKKNGLIGILSIIQGILPIITFIILLIELNDLAMISIVISLIAILILNITNILINRKLKESENGKVALTILIVIVLTNVIFGITIIIKHHSNVKRFEEAIEKSIANQNFLEDKKVYVVYDRYTNKYIEFDENWTQLSEREYTSFNNFSYRFKYNGTPIYIGIAQKGKIGELVNTNFETLFSFKGDMYTFIKVMEDSNKKVKKINLLEDVNNSANEEPSYTLLEKYEDAPKTFEENQMLKYMYFKNPEISNKVLQVVFLQNLEQDNTIGNLYKNEYYEIYNYNKIQDFYNYKKEYYLVDFEKGTKVKMECNNLMYQAIQNGEKLSERIVLFSNGYIPFFDENENGYFNLNGEKFNTNNDYIVYDIINNKVIMMDNILKHTFILSSETSQVEKKLDGKIEKIGNIFLLSDTVNEKYSILDNQLNTLISSKDEIEIIDQKTFLIKDDTQMVSKIYSQKNGNLQEVFSSKSCKCMTSHMDVFVYSNIYDILQLTYYDEE